MTAWQNRPLAPRRHRKTVRGRRAPSKGEVLEALNEEDVIAAALEWKAESVEVVAVCFLFSYLNPAHEDQARPDLPRVRETFRSNAFFG